MIVVEGPDGAGKTTLAKQIAGALDLRIAPRVVSQEAKALKDLKVWVTDNLESGLKPIIYDRHRLISEPIYGPVLRRHMEPGFDDWRWLSYRQTRFRQLDPMIIFCLPPLNAVKESVMDDENNKVVAETIEIIYWLYFNAATLWSDAPIYDWTMTTSTIGVHEITRRCETWLAKKGLKSPSTDG